MTNPPRQTELHQNQCAKKDGHYRALAAQWQLRHKNRKQEYQAVFWFIVVAHVGVLGWLTWSGSLAAAKGSGAFSFRKPVASHSNEISARKPAASRPGAFTVRKPAASHAGGTSARKPAASRSSGIIVEVLPPK